MVEVESKYRVEDFTAVLAWLRSQGVGEPVQRVDADHYHNAPDRDFARTDEALRLRRIGSKNYVTYKGPKIDSATKSRPEVEVPLADGDEAAEDFLCLLGHLGYKLVTVVRKHRLVYAATFEGLPLQVCLDELPGVGRFVELEMVVADADYPVARDRLLRAATDLELTQIERRSYLQMVLEQGGRPA